MRFRSRGRRRGRGGFSRRRGRAGRRRMARRRVRPLRVGFRF